MIVYVQRNICTKTKKAREETGFTQREISRETKIPQSTLANYETGRTEPDIENIGILADFYEIDLNWLFGVKGGKSEYNYQKPKN